MSSTEAGGSGPETGSTPQGVTRWRKKPVEVDMILWDGSEEAWQLIANHGGLPERLPDGSINIWVEASQAEMNLDPGAWAIIEQDGSGVYPCRAADHVTTYEPVTSPDPAGDRVLVTRDQLADALTRLDVSVLTSGPAAGMINADSMAAAIMEALAAEVTRMSLPHQPAEVTVGEVRDLLARAGVPHAEDTHYAIVAAQHDGALIILTCCDGVDDVAGLLREGLAATTSEIPPASGISNRVIVRADDLRKLLATPGAATTARDELGPVVARLSAAAEVTR